MTEPVNRNDNGRPYMPSLVAQQGTLPSFLTSNQYERNYSAQKNETKLRIFSGTANPLLSQVPRIPDSSFVCVLLLHLFFIYQKRKN